jgi:arsenate reductase-like glutaredoxin family protein
MSKFMNAVKKSNKVEKAPAKKKSTGATINPSDAIKESVDELVAAKKNLAVAKADISALEPEIIDAAREVQNTDALKGNFRKSYDVRGHESTIKFVTANKFSIAEDDIKDLSELLGDEFENMVETSYTVKLKAEVFDDDELSDELMALLGDKFETFFETVTHRKVCPGFDKKLYNLDDETREDVKELAKQAKPALK